jgi:hypothetical protein
MTTDILLHSEHGGGCPSGFITKEIENKENWEGISRGRKKCTTKVGRKESNKPSKETEKQITVMYGEYYCLQKRNGW